VHGPEVSGAPCGASAGVVVTVTVTGAAGGCVLDGAGAGDVVAVTVTVEAGAAGVVRSAEQPASSTTASKGSAISFMSTPISMKYFGPGGLARKGCGTTLGVFLARWLRRDTGRGRYRDSLVLSRYLCEYPAYWAVAISEGSDDMGPVFEADIDALNADGRRSRSWPPLHTKSATRCWRGFQTIRSGISFVSAATSPLMKRGSSTNSRRFATPSTIPRSPMRSVFDVMALSHNGYQMLVSTGTYRVSADAIPVCPKSSPFHNSGSRVSRASAYERQSPKFSPARWPLPLPKSA